ncbi:MAG TPA: flagellar export chaperone FliS [Burkholderiaceae bacterium]|nr:flagellar export chaperone FliS [Burkholderiaceae bacterium]HMY98399.1 flagellar export chaperone FliS [Burkholderiaceae bacterium]
MAHMYHQVGVQTGASMASPHTLTLMLFDGFLDAVKYARQAMSDGRTQDKGRHIGHAARIVDEGLKAALNLQGGGELAMNLRDLYDYAQVRLMHANLRNDDRALVEVLALIEPLRDAWVAIGGRLPS